MRVERLAGWLAGLLAPLSLSLVVSCCNHPGAGQSASGNSANVGSVPGNSPQSTHASEATGKGPANDAKHGEVFSIRGPGHVAFGLPGKGFALIEAMPHVQPKSIDELLGPKFAGEDKSVTISANGPWMTLVTTRFGCGSWPCLAVGRLDEKKFELVKPGGKAVHPEGPATVSSDGTLVIWEGQGEQGHQRDLYASRKGDGGWQAPVRITAKMNAKFFGWPSLSWDAKRVVFDCGDVPYAGEGTGLCVAETNGWSVKRILQAGGPGWQQSLRAAHHGGFAPDGSVVFEADRKGSGESVWRWSNGKLTAVGNFHNDNSPCVLPDGRIASLYLGRPGSAGHELKLMSPKGGDVLMLVEGKDLRDVVLSCGP